jgi:predicted dehydrogenase
MTNMLTKETSFPRVAVMGCGKWGKNLARNFAELGTLAAVCDKDRDTAQSVATQYEVPSFSEDTLFTHPEIEAIVIATEASSHEAHAEAALKAGKHVYIEKPMTLSTLAAQKLCSLAKTHNCILMVGHILNYHPAFIALKNHLQDLGPLRHIYATRLGLGRFRHQESVLWDLASHDVSLILALTQAMPQSVSAIGQAYLTPQKPASALLTMTFSNGLTAHIQASWLSPFKEQKLVVIGERGIAVFDDCKPWSEKLQVSTECLIWQEGLCHANEGVQTKNIPLSSSEPLKNECLHFLTCIQKGKAPLTSGQEGLRVTEVLEKAEHSLQTRNNI